MMYKLTHWDYYEGLKSGRLLGLKCNDCGTYTAPPKISCANCQSDNLEVVTLSGKGEIKTYTVIRVAPEGLEAPYVVAMVALEEGPWLVGNLTGITPDEASMQLIGQKVNIGHKEVAFANYTAGRGVTPVFILAG